MDGPRGGRHRDIDDDEEEDEYRDGMSYNSSHNGKGSRYTDKDRRRVGRE